MRFFEDIEIGQRRELGSFTFTADAIKKFAAQFDPQRFHLDEEEGRKSLFGGLAASGWHVGSVCMKLLVADGRRRAGEEAARGERVAVWGPSPGFRDLRWLKPVLAGDTLTYASEIASKRVGMDDCRKSLSGSVAAYPVMRQLIGLEFEEPRHSPEWGAVIWARQHFTEPL